MFFDDVVGNIQAQTDSAGFSISGIVDPIKAAKNLCLIFFGEADSGVLHLDNQVSFSLNQTQLNLTANWCIFNGIIH